MFVTGDCTSCVAGDVAVLPPVGEGNITPILGEPTLNPMTGCLDMQVTCAASANGNTHMQFNGAIGGPVVQDDGRVVATLYCNDNGEWEYEEPTRTTVVDDVACIGRS